MTDLIRLWHPTGSYSSRGGASVRIVVLHTSAGATPNKNLGPFIQGDNGVSYHVSFDNVTGGQAAPECWEYVTRGNKPWANCDLNSVSVTGCFCTDQQGGSGWSRSQWLAQDRALWNAAAWVREECQHFGIPIVALTPSQAQGGGRGVCQHMDLGGSGCGHADCGTGFPMDELIKRAKGGVGATPQPEPPPLLLEEESLMQLVLGEDGKAALPIPNHATHLRLVCAQGAHVNVEWVNSTVSTKTYDLTGKKRVDVPCGAGSNGSCHIWSGDAGGPIGATWMLP